MDALWFFLTRGSWPLIYAVVAVGAAVCLLSLPRLFFRTRRCRWLYRRWLKTNGLEEVERDDRLLMQGPWTFRSNTGYCVSRVVFKDGKGATRKAFVRCGDHNRGFLGHHDLDVRWDD